MKSRCLSPDFFTRPQVTTIARELLGKYFFVRNPDGSVCAGVIVETEAYNGVYDKACHAYGNKKTARTSVMYQKGGCLYVYLCYGMHYLLNIVTNVAGKADVALIRALEPKLGIDLMLARRKMKSLGTALTSGPGRLTQALGLGRKHNGMYFSPYTVWVEEGDPPECIATSPRIGVNYAGEDALLPWRFYICGNPWVSKPA
jgi:DNA-3-methyladenine glycosylase